MHDLSATFDDTACDERADARQDDVARPVQVGPALVADRPRVLPVLTPLAFRQAVQAERMSADRDGAEFAVLFVRLDGEAARRADVVNAVAREMAVQVRDGDVVGLRNRNTIAILLHDCPPDRARLLGDRVCESLQGRRLDPNCRVVAYEQRGPSRMPLRRMLHRPSPLWKRTVDLTMAGTALVLLCPLIGLVACAIKVSDRGPILFTQKRAGLGGRPFEIYKFRTMVVNAEALKAALRNQSEQDGPAFKIKRDPRITRMGGFLRKSSLDELPQLWNIIKGDMSLVGPRPLPIDEQAGCNRWQSARLDVVPGLTCHWQVEGRSRVTFEDWMRMDLRYLHGRTLLRDLKILLATVPAVLARRGSQ